MNPLSVSIQPCGKKKGNCRFAPFGNGSFIEQNVKYEDCKFAMAYFAKDSYIFTFDLKSGYHHIKILEGQQTFRGFS